MKAILQTTTMLIDGCPEKCQAQILAMTKHRTSAFQLKYLEILTKAFQKALNQYDTKESSCLITWEGINFDDTEQLAAYRDSENQAEYLRGLASGADSVVYTIEDMSNESFTIITYQVLDTDATPTI